MHPRETAWYSFTVGLAVPGGLHGGGVLYVSPEALVALPGAVTRVVGRSGPVQHRGARVEVWTARLLPPWFSVSLPIIGEEGGLVASLPVVMRGKLLAALTACGFDVAEHRTWTETAMSVPSLWRIR